MRKGKGLKKDKKSDVWTKSGSSLQHVYSYSTGKNRSHGYPNWNMGWENGIAGFATGEGEKRFL